jgi:hypothetical protein
VCRHRGRSPCRRTSKSAEGTVLIPSAIFNFNNVHAQQVFDDHYREPLPARRHYHKDENYARLIAPACLAFLQWIPVSEPLGRYKPIMVPWDTSGSRCYIGRFRHLEDSDYDGSLMLLSEDLRPLDRPWTPVMANPHSGLHVLASPHPDGPIYWVNRRVCPLQRATCTFLTSHDLLVLVRNTR